MTDFASLCVLSFNRPRFLSEMLSTLIEANREDSYPYELIVHDDGSADARVYYLLNKLHQESLTSTLILNTPGHNQGQGIALNRMFGMAKGKAIFKLDQDLLFHPGWLRKSMDLLGSNEQAVEDKLEPRIGLLGLMKYEHEPVDWRVTQLESFVGWSSHTHILGSAFALTRRSWEELGPFEEHSDAFAEDNAMQVKVTESRDYVCALPDVDLCVNQGMGFGPSTVVTKAPTETEPGAVRAIYKEPFIHARD